MQVDYSLIRKENNQLKTQNGFLKLKVNYLQTKKQPSQISLINKQLYLNYMEDVLTNKQSELIELEQELSGYYQQKNEQEANNKILIPLSLSTQLQIMSKKIEEVKKTLHKSQKLEHKIWDDFFSKEKQIVLECKKYQKQTQDLVRQEYQKMIDERKEITQKMAKFYELNAYQKYLSELQKLLQNKQEELLQKQQQIFQQQQITLRKIQNSQQKSIKFINDSNLFIKDQAKDKDCSDRKRVKIFDSNKKDITSSYKSKNVNQNFNNLCNESFGFTNSQSKIQNSSQIMLQHPTNTYSSQFMSDKRFEAIHSNSMSKQIQAQAQKIKIQQSIELQKQENKPNQTLEQSMKRLQNQRKYCKFANLWLKYSFKSQKSTNPIHKKTMILYLWRLNALYDSNILKQIKHREELDWPLKLQKSLRNKKQFPYNQLSLKRKKYCEMVFDHDKKQLHQKKIKCLLKSIFKNKIRKERLCVYIYFKRYNQNVKLRIVQEHYKMTLFTKISNKEMPITESAETSRNHADSRLISMTSSHIMHQTKPLFGETKELVQQKLNKSRLTSNQLVSKSPSSMSLFNKSYQKNNKNSKQNIMPSLNGYINGIDAKKLKDYIKTQQETQKALATQCIQTQSLLKLSQAMTSLINKRLFSCYIQIRVLSQEQRVSYLLKKINSFEFKWQLFTTKCKLNLVHNSSKISQLQDTLAFMIDR